MNSVEFVKHNPGRLSSQTLNNFDKFLSCELITHLGDGNPSSKLLAEVFDGLSLAATGGSERSLGLVGSERLAEREIELLSQLSHCQELNSALVLVAMGQGVYTNLNSHSTAIKVESAVRLPDQLAGSHAVSLDESCDHSLPDDRDVDSRVVDHPLGTLHLRLGSFNQLLDLVRNGIECIVKAALGDSFFNHAAVVNLIGNDHSLGDAGSLEVNMPLLISQLRMHVSLDFSLDSGLELHEGRGEVFGLDSLSKLE